MHASKRRDTRRDAAPELALGVPYALAYEGLAPAHALRRALTRLADLGVGDVLTAVYGSKIDGEALGCQLASLALEAYDGVVAIMVTCLADDALIGLLCDLRARLAACEVRTVTVVSVSSSADAATAFALAGFVGLPSQASGARSHAKEVAA